MARVRVEGDPCGRLLGEVVNKHGQDVEKVLVDEELAKPHALLPALECKL